MGLMPLFNQKTTRYSTSPAKSCTRKAFPDGLPDAWQRALAQYAPRYTAPVLHGIVNAIRDDRLDSRGYTVADVQRVLAAQNMNFSRHTVRGVLEGEFVEVLDDTERDQSNLRLVFIKREACRIISTILMNKLGLKRVDHRWHISKEAVSGHTLLEMFPEPFNQIHIGRVRWQPDHNDALLEQTQKSLHRL
jgi:hypothetical protein